jgi:hypothetical protein
VGNSQNRVSSHPLLAAISTYARDIYDASPRAFFRFARVSGLAEHRENVPREAWFAAKIAAAMAEECGPCTQLVVTMAEREGVSPPTLCAILAGEQGALPPDAALGFRFARALERDVAEGNRLRDEVVSRWGRKGLVTLALTIAASRIFPADYSGTIPTGAFISA